MTDKNKMATSDLSNQTALVLDWGYFPELAKSLGGKDGYGTTIYGTAWHKMCIRDSIAPCFPYRLPFVIRPGEVCSGSFQGLRDSNQQSRCPVAERESSKARPRK